MFLIKLPALFTYLTSEREELIGSSIIEQLKVSIFILNALLLEIQFLSTMGVKKTSKMPN